MAVACPMNHGEHKEIFLNDYTPPTHNVKSVHLTFELDANQTKVKNQVVMQANHNESNIEFHGEKQKLISIFLNNQLVNESDYSFANGKLIIQNTPTNSQFNLEINTEVDPQNNTSLEGLYMSSGMFCTQNEPHGFRRITCFFDRPDVMTKYTTTIIANKEKFPILLSNGNCVEIKNITEGDGKLHSATWVDPFKKPSYLFALVAGDLGFIEDTFVTLSGKKVDLKIFTDKGKESMCNFAMQALKKSMKWDEENFGLEYDLDIFNIVAVADFNFGAMENKSLNIFNSRLVLADKKTTTDDLFEDIEAVIGHEYFHNYTGNRITCRDWFQITLKEGLTVYRDERFTQDMTDKDVKRIKDASMMRSYQFPEDAGPMSHPIQPKSYIEVNNFYTATVYNKGAEVIRMFATLIGEKCFRKGFDKYFELYDGQAVTVNEFRNAMQLASPINLDQMQTWYDQNRTPELNYNYTIDKNEKTLTITFEQSCPMIGKDLAKKPFLIPIRFALITNNGTELDLKTNSHQDLDEVDTVSEKVLQLTESKQTFIFENITEEVKPSVLRGFSAPVKITHVLSNEDLTFFVANETDPFNRWDAHQKLLTKLINRGIANVQNDKPAQVPQDYFSAFENILEANIPPAMKALLLTIPSEGDFTNEQKVADHLATHKARKQFIKIIAEEFKGKLLIIYDELSKETSTDPKIIMGNRKFRNRVLSYLVSLEDERIDQLCYLQMKNAVNMSNEQPAFVLLCQSNSHLAKQAIQDFRIKWAGNDLVITTWFSAQAGKVNQNTIEHIKQLMNDSEFNIKNPNKVRALLGAFTRNGVVFHSANGYKFLIDQIIELNMINPNIAAGLTRAFTRIKNVNNVLKQIAKNELQRLLGSKGLSPDVYEIAKNCFEF